MKLAAFLKKLGPNALGEALRAITFVGDGVGCYENFSVRPDATFWSSKEIAALIKERFDNLDGDIFVIKAFQGYTFKEGSLTVDVFWIWDGDGTLYFRLRDGQRIIREIVNYNCKKDYG